LKILTEGRAVRLRRSLLFALGIFASLALTAGCSKQQGGAPAKTGAESGAKRYRIAVVPKGTIHEFWLTVKAGAEKAGEETGAQIIWKGPSRETDIEGQIAILEGFITGRVDAIVMAACDSKALIPTVRKATEAGIPVVTIDSGIDDDKLPVSFVATDNVEGARKAARELARLIGYSGKVGLIPFVPGAATSIMREQGFREEIRKFPKIILGPVDYSQSQVDVAMRVTENMLTGHKDLKGIFAANESSAMGAVQALETRGLAGKVKLVAFDAADSEIEALKRGTIQALIVQNPFAMGYLGVKAAVDKLNGKPVKKRIDTGVTVVTKENMNNPEIQKILYPLGK
jgi:ribose transport system substrate-binding protein